ncbi:hypothetical protein VP01_3518g1 [Puccinia sorghi]|uniref:Uncharacterized protein n=1 Tax=Puccinia sorghi TaxID=27349 RepID=A0A0L6UVQ0_9BASI|nr:hypothetical protein VP01_3518g1 [Puccinia sorghi]
MDPSELFKRKWAATSGHVIYLDLQEAILNCIKVGKSLHFQNKLTLIHDVWTLKGNRCGFIGASVSFIDNDWNYVVQHHKVPL